MARYRMEDGTVIDTERAIGESVQRMTLRVIRGDNDAAYEARRAANKEDGTWAASSQPRCTNCRESFDDGESIILYVRVEESEAVSGRPGCSEKKAYHEECADPELIAQVQHNEEVR